VLQIAQDLEAIMLQTTITKTVDLSDLEESSSHDIVRHADMWQTNVQEPINHH
jgi:hypothetical protein